MPSRSQSALSFCDLVRLESGPESQLVGFSSRVLAVCVMAGAVCVCEVGLWCVDCARAAYLVLSLSFALFRSLSRAHALERYAAQTS